MRTTDIIVVDNSRADRILMAEGWEHEQVLDLLNDEIVGVSGVSHAVTGISVYHVDVRDAKSIKRRLSGDQYN